MSSTITGTAIGLVTLTSAGANPATIDYGALLQAGLYGEGATAWTVTNFGTINNSGSLLAVTLHDGGTLSNASAGVISASGGIEVLRAAGTVTNAGSISAGAGIGISLADGGFVSNATGAHISASLHAIVVSGAAGTVTNSGTILAGNKAVYLYEGGTVTNLSGGTLSGFAGVKFATTGAGTVVNGGFIYGSNNGIYLRDGGLVTNQAGGTIASGARGVYVSGLGAATVTNAGVIIGTTAAVKFTAGFADRLIIDPGATFTGTVNGGNSIGSATVSTLELASGSAAGTLSGLGSKYTQFAAITIDAGATWTLSADTIGSGYTLTDGGTLTNTGSLGSTVTMSSGAVLTNAAAATISASGGAIDVIGSAGSLQNDGVIIAINATAVDDQTTYAVLSNASLATIAGRYGVYLYDSDSLINAGLISATGTAGWGVLSAGYGNGNVISNASSGTIIGAAYGIRMYSSSTVLNTGLISATGTAGDGVLQGLVSTVSNASGGTITGAAAGVVLGDFSTLINAGLVSATGTTGRGANAAAGANQIIRNASGGTIIGAAVGVYLSTTDTLTNAGLISATGTAGRGVHANGAADVISNASTGTITAVTGVYLSASGRLANQGRIAGANTGVQVHGSGATVTTSGSISGGTDAVLFHAGYSGDRLVVDPGATFTGTVNGGNSIGSATVSTLELASGSAAGTLSGLGSKYTQFAAITIDAGATWTLSTDTIGSGYTLTDGGTLTNTGSLGSTVTMSSGAVLTNAAAATISASGGAIDVIGSAGSLQNDGVIIAINATAVDDQTTYAVLSNASLATIAGRYGVYLYDSDSLINAGLISATGTAGWGVLSAGYGNGNVISNASSGTIIGAAYGIRMYSSSTVLNTGLISATGTAGDGVLQGLVSTVSNASGGTITGAAAGVVLGDFSTLINAGLVSATGTTGRGANAAAGANQIIRNASGGTIIGAAVGVYLSTTDTLTNAGLISATGTAGRGVHANGAADVISNASTGTITAVTGVYLSASGRLANQGRIAGANTGVQVHGSGATVTTSGSISGGTDAVLFHAGYSGDRLVIDPGATFTGTVNGGNSIGSATVSTLELASGSAAGTLSGLGSKYTQFAAITIDAGATWTLSTDTIGSGYTLTDGGTLTNTGSLGSTVTMSSGAVLTNAAAATISASGGAIDVIGSAGSLQNDGVIIAINATAVDDQTTYAVLSNASLATIAGRYGVYLYNSDSLINAGLISATGTAGWGVLSAGYGNGNVISNASSGTIIGAAYGIRMYSSSTVLNTGLISATGTAGDGVLQGLVSTVSNASGGTITGAAAGVVLGDFSTLINAGLVSATGTTGRGANAAAGANQIIRNASGGTIIGAAVGVYLSTTDTLTNAGLISATGTAGRGVHANGAADVISNASTGTITAVTGVYFSASGRLANQGRIAGANTGVQVHGSGATVTTSGSISGGTDAVLFHAGYSGDRLVVDPGATFTGTVNGGNSIGSATVSTLELASGSAAGTLSGFSQFTNFSQITLDSGGTWTLTAASTLASGITLSNAGTLVLSGAPLTDTGTLVNNGHIVIDPSTLTVGGLYGTGSTTIDAGSTLIITGSVAVGETIVFAANTGDLVLDPSGGTFSGLIDGFVSGDTITLNGVGDTTAINVVNSHTLAITSTSLGTIDLRLDPTQTLSDATFNAPVSSGSTVITADDLACFAAGTRIDTPAGPVPVEALREGDLVLTASGAARPVRWVGWRQLNPRRHPRPWRAQPIRVLAGAIAPGVPRRDLLLSPDHAVVLDGMLITVRQLLNGATIRQDDVDAVTYYHVELDTHDVLLAEGMAVESYLDTGNRNMFENAATALTLHPFQHNDQALRVASSCLPFVDDAETVEPLWIRIAARAVEQGRRLPRVPVLTQDPALCLLAAGRRFLPLAAGPGRFQFVMPVNPGVVRVCSRQVPANLLQPWVRDDRRLGLMVRHIVVRRDWEVLLTALDDPALVRGWWPVERQGQALWRWTDGDAVLPLPDGGVSIVDITIGDPLAYPIERAETARTAPFRSTRRDDAGSEQAGRRRCA